MWATILKILQALVTAVPALLDWWQRHQAAQAQTEAEDRVDNIRRDPAGEWMREFNKNGNSGTSADSAGADEPNADT